tara:strand:+ start:2187 stop:2546 length:360 start_codon:yes stop_codon:yes gene_type:complete
MERTEEILDQLETTQMQRTKEVILEQISTIIEENVNPAVASHGGMIRLEDFDMESGRVLVMLSGGCSGCASSTITLKMGVENMLKHYVPEVTAVDGMDDPNFNNPYYVDDGMDYHAWED